MNLRPAFETPLLAAPNTGSKSISIPLNFTATATVEIDIAQELMQGQLGLAQSVFIDNADNSAVLDLTLHGAPRPIRIRAGGNSQGWYPLPWPVGAGRITAASNSGATIDILIANYPMPYVTWGPTTGITVVPALVNRAFNPLPIAASGNTVLVAGVGGQTAKLYRGIFSVDQPATLKFTDGAGGTVLFSAILTAGGSLTFQPSGAPWFNASIGNDLVLNMTVAGATNLAGGFGFVQS